VKPAEINENDQPQRVEDLAANFLGGKRLGRNTAEAAQREKEIIHSEGAASGTLPYIER